MYSDNLSANGFASGSIKPYLYLQIRRFTDFWSYEVAAPRVLSAVGWNVHGSRDMSFLLQVGQNSHRCTGIAIAQAVHRYPSGFLSVSRIWPQISHRTGNKISSV